ncbi:MULTISPECIES: sorbosone dehydrogenase family protein [unclassified Sphingomonas]|uniref:PQQ-dependent sugar dehydrogenase n=1 Tax=unclassified Sphingomonas TaxID=196159 RepID=UPI00226A40C8|nr:MULTISPECIES: sorbosone dehydrogenase family protein [unclassified Sphingomonas]
MSRARIIAGVAGLSLAMTLAACDDGGKHFDRRTQIGAHPVLPAPQQYLIPPIHVAEVVGWGANETPTAPPGMRVQAFARDLNHPRNIAVLPNGDVLVIESQGPNLDPVTRPKNPIVSWVQKRATGQSGAKPKGETNQITLLRDADGDGVPEQRTVLVGHLNSPFGVVFADNFLYVAATDAVLSYPFTPGQTKITAPPVRLTELPGGPIDHHWTKSLTLSPDGKLLYATVGSNSNITENGMEAEKNRAAVWEIERATGRSRVFAGGLRNPNSPNFYPGTNTLWVVANERDELGPNLVPDYLTSVRDGGFYGWPYSYYGQHVDPRVQPQRPDLVAKAIAPDYALSSHVAALGLTFYTGTNLPARYRGGAFIGEHGSWDRDELNGYKIAFVPFANARPSGIAEDFLTGFVGADGKVRGRPVGVTVDRTGALLVADDTGNVVWRVTAAR